MNCSILRSCLSAGLFQDSSSPVLFSQCQAFDHAFVFFCEMHERSRNPSLPFFVFEMWSNSMSSVQYGSLPFLTDVCVKKTSLNNGANTEMFGYANAIQRHSCVIPFFGFMIIRMYTIVRTWSSGPFVGIGSEVVTFWYILYEHISFDWSRHVVNELLPDQDFLLTFSYPVQNARNGLIAVCEV